MSTPTAAGVPRNNVVSISPTTGELLSEYEQHSDETVEGKLALAAERFREYRKIPFAQRSQMMTRAAEILEGNKEAYGRLMTQEMGKPFRAAIQEAEKCALGCRYYAQNAEKFLADEEAKTSATRCFVRYQPLGPVLAVMPWNFPFWQVFRFAAPALMAGNTGLLKHASNVPQSALAIEDILHRAGFPRGAFQTLLIDANQVDPLLKDDRIVAATLTGSEPAGRSVAGSSGG